MTLSCVTSELSGVADWVNRDFGVVQVRMKFLSMNKFENEFNVSCYSGLTPLRGLHSSINELYVLPIANIERMENELRLIDIYKIISRSKEKINQSHYKSPSMWRIRHCSKEF